MADNIRKKRIGAQIQRALGTILLRNPKHSIFKQITITAVEVAADLSVAKVFFSIIDESKIKQVKEILKNESWFLRKTLARDLNLRLTPRLYFVYDVSITHGQTLSALIDQAITENKEKN